MGVTLSPLLLVEVRGINTKLTINKSERSRNVSDEVVR